MTDFFFFCKINVSWNTYCQPNKIALEAPIFSVTLSSTSNCEDTILDVVIFFPVLYC